MSSRSRSRSRSRSSRSGSTTYSAASTFVASESAEDFDYLELMSVLTNFSKARVGGAGATWTKDDVLSNVGLLRTKLRALLSAIEGVDPGMLQFTRFFAGRVRKETAQAAIEEHIANLRKKAMAFSVMPTAGRFEEIQTYLADVLAPDIEKMASRQSRVILGNSQRGISSQDKSSSSLSSYYSNSDGSSNSGYGSRGGARRPRSKKLTRRRQRR